MKYLVNKNAQINTGYHKVHTIDCKRGPRKENAIILGECICLVEAKDRAKEHYKNVTGCKYCCENIFYQK